VRAWIAGNKRLVGLLVLLALVVTAKIVQVVMSPAPHHTHTPSEVTQLHQIELHRFGNEGSATPQEIVAKPYVLLEFFSLSCRYCQKSIPTLNRLNRHPKLSVIGYAQANPKPVLEYAKAKGVAYTLCQTSLHYFELFNPVRVPVSYLVDTKSLAVKARFMGEVDYDEVVSYLK